MNLAPPISLSAILPELILLVAGCAVLLLGQARSDGWRRLMPWTALAALVAALAVVVARTRGDAWDTAGLIRSGLEYASLALFVRISALELGILIALVNWSLGKAEERGEFLSMMLFSITGLLLVGPADNLLVLFLALELVSIPTYVMVVLSRTNVRSLEAGTKYFYLGALSAAIMAYGFSFIYGVAGTASLSAALPAVQEALAHPGTLRHGLAVVGVVLSLGGLLFKIAAVPLHFYVADVYQGAASPVAGLLGFVPKLAGFIAIFRFVLISGHWELSGTAVFWLLWIIAVATMTVGNVLALRQTNVKRLLAYSGIAHSGYMLVGVLAGPVAGGPDGVTYGVMGNGTAAALYYVVIYGIANLGAFAVLGLLRAGDQPCETLRDVAGLIRRHPGLALLMVLAMFTLMGLPPTPGFWGKLSLFGSALASAEQYGPLRPWLIALVIIAVLNSAMAAAYYLRVIAAILVYETDKPAHALPREAQQIGAMLCGFLLLIFMFYPNGLLRTGQEATSELTNQITLAAEPPEQEDPPPVAATDLPPHGS